MISVLAFAGALFLLFLAAFCFAIAVDLLTMSPAEWRDIEERRYRRRVNKMMVAALKARAALNSEERGGEG